MEKANKKKKWSIILLVVLLLLGGGGYYAYSNGYLPFLRKETPTEAVDKYLTELKERSFAEIFGVKEDGLSAQEKETYGQLTKLFQSESYTLDNEVIEGDKAHVDIHYSVFNFLKAFDKTYEDLINEMPDSLFSTIFISSLSDKQIQDKVGRTFCDELKALEPDGPTVPFNYTAELEKQDGVWKITNLEKPEFISGLFGNLVEFGELYNQKEAEKLTAIEDHSFTKPEPPKPDYSAINGKWESEKLSNGAYLNFTIDFPKVTNFNGDVTEIKESDDPAFQYEFYLLNDGGRLYLRISDLEDGKAKIWYPDDNQGFTNSLVLNRVEELPKEEQEEAVVDKPSQNNTASSKPSGSGSSNSGSGSSGGGSSSGKSGHYEDQLVCVKEAYDEQVLVKKGECTQVCVQEAYDTEEMVYLDGAFYGPDTEERAWCYTCEHFYDDHCELAGHAFNNKTVNLTEPYWHNVEYRTVHHDAVYETRCEPDEYTTVHHDAVYETRRVWVED